LGVRRYVAYPEREVPPAGGPSLSEVPPTGGPCRGTTVPHRGAGGGWWREPRAADPPGGSERGCECCVLPGFRRIEVFIFVVAHEQLLERAALVFGPVMAAVGAGLTVVAGVVGFLEWRAFAVHAIPG